MFSCSDFSRLLNLTWRYPAYFVKYSSSLFTFKFAFSVITGNSPMKVITLSLLSVWTTCFLPHWAMLSWTWSFELQALNAMCVCHLRCTMYNAIDSSMDSTTSKTLALRRIPDQVRSIGYWLILGVLLHTLVNSRVWILQGLCGDDIEVSQSSQNISIKGDSREICKCWPLQSCDYEACGQTSFMICSFLSTKMLKHTDDVRVQLLFSFYIFR